MSSISLVCTCLTTILKEHHPIFIFHARDRQQSVISNSIDPPPVEHSPQSSLGRLPRLNELPVDVVNGPVCLDRMASSLPDAARASHALMAPFMLKETAGVRNRPLSQMADKRPRSDSATLSPSSVRPQKRPSKLLKSPSSDVEIIERSALLMSTSTAFERQDNGASHTLIGTITIPLRFPLADVKGSFHQRSRRLSFGSWLRVADRIFRARRLPRFLG